jgi:hypothetical protein
MRFPTFALLLGASLPACHCNPSFRTQLQGQMTIPGDPLGGLLNIPGVPSLTNIDFNQNRDFVNEGITKDKVNSAIADSVQLQITSPSNQDFKFLDNLQLVAKAAGMEAVIAQKTSIAQLNLPAPNPVLNMDVTKSQLKPYVTASSMSIDVRGSGRAPNYDTQINITIGMEIEVHVY